MSENQRKNLGDLLAPGSEFLEGRRRPSYTPKPLTRAEGERLLTNVSEALSLDPTEVLDAFNKGGVLSEFIRRFARIEEKPDLFWEAIDMIETVRSEGLKGRRAFDEAARRLNSSRSLGGANRNISANSLELYWTNAQTFRKAWAVSLAALFAQEPCRPSRKIVKEVLREKRR